MSDPRTRPSDPTLSGIIDFQAVAALIDAVAAVAPGRLPALLQVLRSSDERLEARVVVDVALRCRDPLAPLATLCRDALRTAADFNQLLRSRGWHSVRELCPRARANAALHLCDEILADSHPARHKRRRRCGQIRARLEAAALEERSARADDLERLEAARAEHCPLYWQVLRSFLAAVLSGRA